jgi:Mg-chelatase subunit ChlD
LSFRFDQPELLWLLLLALPIGWLGATHLTTVEPLRKWIAIGLRALVLLLLVLMLAGLNAERRHTDLTVIAVIDQSPSMQVFGQPPPAPGRFNPTAGSDNPGDGPQRTVSQAVTDYLAAAADERRPDDRFGVVVYDERPSVVRRPRPDVDLDLAADREVREGTDTAQALEWAMAAKADADTALRLVLVSDGNDTSGDTLAAARAAAAAGVVVDVLPIDYRLRDEVMVEGVYTPTEAREGQTVAVRVVLRATTPTRGTLLLRHDGRLLDLNGEPAGRGLPIAPDDWTDARAAEGLDDEEQPAAVDGAVPTAASGRFVLVKQIDVPIAIAGANRFEAIYEPAQPTGLADALSETASETGSDPMTGSTSGRAARSSGGGGGDTVAINNRAESFTLVRGQGRVLVVDHLGGAPGRILPDALRQREIELDVVRPEAFPQDAATLSRYDAVLFQNVPAERITGRQQTVLARYVNDLGGGFVMLGGPDSFGPGGWTNTVIDRNILPVACEVPTQTILPTGALVICLDRSGSMSMPVGNTGRTQLELAGEAAILAIQTLYPQDLVGVIAFDSAPTWVVELQENDNPARSAQLIRSMQASGGTNLSTGLQLAYDALSRQEFADRSVKHCILLTDGQEPAQNYQQLMAKFADQGITLTTVGVGDNQNTPLLQDLARLGDGTYYPIANPMDLPQVFIKEARSIRKNLVREGRFDPQRVNTGSPIMTNLPATPPLNGLVLTGPKYDRRVDMPMLGPEGEPLFAHWQVGLGRAAAWTSDATNKWATPWLGWSGYSDFWARTVRYVSRPGATPDAELTSSFDGNTLSVRLETTAMEGDFGAAAASLNVAGKVLRPDGEVADLTLQQTGPGVYTGSLPASATGSYLVNLFLQPRGGGPTKFVAGGSTRVPGAELRRFAANRTLLEQVAATTGGRVLDPADPVAANLFDRTHRFESVSTRPLRWLLLPWLLVALLTDVVNRRLAWDHRAIGRWVRDKATVQRRSSTQTKQTMSALKQRRAAAKDRVNEVETPPTETPRPDQRKKFRAEPTAKPSDDFAAAVGSARDADAPAKPITSNGEADPEPATTNRLLAAKRRAQEKHS